MQVLSGDRARDKTSSRATAASSSVRPYRQRRHFPFFHLLIGVADGSVQLIEGFGDHVVEVAAGLFEVLLVRV